MITLTQRQIDVLAWMAGGATAEETAAELGLTVGTVKSHIVKLRERLGAKTITHAVTRGFEERILLLDEAPATAAAIAVGQAVIATLGEHGWAGRSEVAEEIAAAIDALPAEPSRVVLEGPAHLVAPLAKALGKTFRDDRRQALVAAATVARQIGARP